MKKLWREIRYWLILRLACNEPIGLNLYVIGELQYGPGPEGLIRNCCINRTGEGGITTMPDWKNWMANLAAGH